MIRDSADMVLQLSTQIERASMAQSEYYLPDTSLADCHAADVAAILDRFVAYAETYNDRFPCGVPINMDGFRAKMIQLLDDKDAVRLLLVAFEAGLEYAKEMKV